MTEPSIRIVVADDHRLLREALCDLLARYGDFTVVGQACDGEETIKLAALTQPHIVLLDLEMPQHTPAETMRRLRLACPRTSIVVLSMHDSPQVVRSMLGAGADGYLHKGIGASALAAAIRAAALGGAEHRLILSVSPGTITPAADAGNALTERETEVLQLVAGAASNRQVARTLGIAEATVKRHLRNAFNKLGAVSRIDAVNRAQQAGQLTAPSRVIDVRSAVVAADQRVGSLQASTHRPNAPGRLLEGSERPGLRR